MRAYEVCYAEIVPATEQFQAPSARLATMASGYVRFAAAHRPLFEVLYEAGLDKARYPEIEVAERRLTDAFMACVRAISGDGEGAAAGDGDGAGAGPGEGAGEGAAEELATAVEATAPGRRWRSRAGTCSPGLRARSPPARRVRRALPDAPGSGRGGP